MAPPPPFHNPGWLWTACIADDRRVPSVQQALTKLLSATNDAIMGKPNTNDRPRIMFTLFTFH